MVRAIDLVHEGKADAVISLGNTGVFLQRRHSGWGEWRVSSEAPSPRHSHSASGVRAAGRRCQY
jgi:hypothetical protein